MSRVDQNGYHRWGDISRPHRRIVRLLLACETRGLFEGRDLGEHADIRRQFGEAWVWRARGRRPASERRGLRRGVAAA